MLSEQICRPNPPLLAPIRACEAAEPRVLVEEAGRLLLPSVRFFGVAELTTICCTIPSPERRGQLQSELWQGLETAAPSSATADVACKEEHAKAASFAWTEAYLIKHWAQQMHASNATGGPGSIKQRHRDAAVQLA